MEKPTLICDLRELLKKTVSRIDTGLLCSQEVEKPSYGFLALNVISSEEQTDWATERVFSLVSVFHVTYWSHIVTAQLQ